MVFTAAVCSVVAALPASPPPHLDPVNRTLWADDQLGIRLTYPGVWVRGNPTQKHTRFMVSWRTKKSKALIAMCYVEAANASQSGIAKLSSRDISNSGKAIAESMLKNLLQRAPDARLMSWKNVQHDGHPVVFIVRHGTTSWFDRETATKVYSLVTAWRGYELNLECATPVFGPEYTSLEGGVQLVEQVEAGMKDVMRSLQFDRELQK